MEKHGKYKVYTLDECIDEHIGPLGTPERDMFEREVEESLRAYRLGEAVRQARKEHNLTQQQLGERADVSRAQISKIEHGRDFTFKALGRVCKALGIDSGTLNLGVAGEFALW